MVLLRTVAFFGGPKMVLRKLPFGTTFFKSVLSSIRTLLTETNYNDFEIFFHCGLMLASQFRLPPLYVAALMTDSVL